MADISQEINDFKNAIYGEEVRDSMISLAEKINTEVEANTTNVNQAVSTANSASSAANQAVADANTTLQAANQAVTFAEGSASAAAGSASAAAGHAEDAEESATAAAGSASEAAQSAADAAEVAEGLGGFNGSASSVTAQDVEGLLGTPGAQSNVQALIDAIAEQVLNQLVKKSQIINNLLATQAGNVLDATQGKALKDLIDQLNSDMSGKVSKTGDVMSNTLSVQKIVGYAAEDWQNAHFLARSLTQENASSRAGYGFENGGINAAFLYLDASLNGLKVRFNDGTLKTIAFTEDL